MKVLLEILCGFATAAAFFLFEPFLLGLDQTWRFAGAGATFFAVVGLAMYVNKKITHTPQRARRVLTGNDARKDLSVDIDGLDATRAEGKVISDNKSGGKTTITVKNSKL